MPITSIGAIELVGVEAACRLVGFPSYDVPFLLRLVDYRSL